MSRGLAFTTLLLVPLLALLAWFFTTRLDADVTAFILRNPPANAFEDKVIWVTGASSGIGEFLAKEVAGKGAKLVLSGRREHELKRVAESLEGRYEALVVAFDMLDTDHHKKAVSTVLDHFGRIDVLVLNAGQTQRGVVAETPLDTVRKIMELNYMSVVSLTQAVLPHMLMRGTGDLVVTSSFSGILATPLSATYAASKHALHGFFNSLRAEIASSGVRVLVACPGPVVSEIGVHAIVANAGNNYSIQSSQRRMPTVRCAQLMAKALWHGLDEVWIAQQPHLSLYYVGQFMPSVYRALSKVLGPGRVAVFKAGGDDYDLSQVIQYAKKERTLGPPVRSTK